MGRNRSNFENRFVKTDYMDMAAMYLLCHIYPGVPHQCAALFSLGLLHYMHAKTSINQHTFSYNRYSDNIDYVLHTCIMLATVLIHVPHYSGYMPVQVHVWSTYLFD